LDYSQFPDNDEARVSDLANNLYSLRTRLRAVETSFNSAATGSAELLHAVQTLKGDWRRRTREVFEKWSRLESADSLLDAWRNQPELSRDLQQQLDRLQHDGAGSAIDETGTQGLYALLGSIKGLLESMEKLQESMNSINWAQYSTPRF
ncbi:MAG TPA: hypothetical protein VET88_08395, partial [Gammaproteobacteria bacterium]|nr:hypothetical protein [Gammaproteobacteria bacterium]